MYVFCGILVLMMIFTVLQCGAAYYEHTLTIKELDRMRDDNITWSKRLMSTRKCDKEG